MSLWLFPPLFPFSPEHTILCSLLQAGDGKRECRMHSYKNWVPLRKQRDTWHKPEVWEESHTVGRAEGMKIEVINEELC